MTTHELAKKLLGGPDLPVIINGWGSDEGFAFAVNEARVGSDSFFHGDRNEKCQRDHLGYPVPRDCVILNY